MYQIYTRVGPGAFVTAETGPEALAKLAKFIEAGYGDAHIKDSQGNVIDPEQIRSALSMLTCIFCADTGWVCENHARRPWEGPYACDCGGAGMPCPTCNLPEEGPPRAPGGLQTGVDKDGWRN
jgi:hypothetical protein